MQKSLLKVFEHSCVAAVGENNQPVMVKIHPLIFLYSGKKIIWSSADFVRLPTDKEIIKEIKKKSEISIWQVLGGKTLVGNHRGQTFLVVGLSGLIVSALCCHNNY